MAWIACTARDSEFCACCAISDACWELAIADADATAAAPLAELPPNNGRADAPSAPMNAIVSALTPASHAWREISRGVGICTSSARVLLRERRARMPLF